MIEEEESGFQWSKLIIALVPATVLPDPEIF
jgi:hypothetical protein